MLISRGAFEHNAGQRDSSHAASQQPHYEHMQNCPSHQTPSASHSTKPNLSTRKKKKKGKEELILYLFDFTSAFFKS